MGLVLVVVSACLFCVTAYARPAWPRHSSPPPSFSFSALSLGDKLVHVSSALQPRSHGALFHSRRSSSSFSTDDGEDEEWAPGFAFVLSRSKSLHLSRVHFSLNVSSRVVSFASAFNVSDSTHTDNDLSSGEQLFAWIDYHAALRTLEVRLSRSSDQRPQDAIISYEVDLATAWRRLLVGFNAKSFHQRAIYFWASSPNNDDMHTDDGHGHGQRFTVLDRAMVQWHLEYARDVWLDCMIDVCRVTICLLLGALIGTTIAGVLLVVWRILERCAASTDEDGSTSKLRSGYKAFPEEGDEMLSP